MRSNVRSLDRLSIKARIRVSILGLVIVIVTALSGLHLYGVVGETLEDAGERALLVAEHAKTHVIETVNREAASLPSGLTLGETKAAWYRIIREDDVLRRVLQKSLTRSKHIVEVVIVDDTNTTLTSSNPASVGNQHTSGRTYAEWQHQSMWARLRQLATDEDYAVTVPLGVVGERKPAVTVRVFISSVLLRASVGPKLRELATVSALSLAASLLLAALVSNLVANSIERISRHIDRIAEGDVASAADTDQLPELMNVQSKLTWLGRQFQGARKDIGDLRSNIDQLLRRLEEAVLVFGPDGRLQMAGDPAVRLLGKGRAELSGRMLEEVFPTWMHVGSRLHQMATSRTPVRDQPVTLPRANMTPARLLMNVEPVDYGDGRVGTIVTLRDAESRRQLRTQLDTAQRLSAISRLAAGVAHEIKNPLNAMMLHLEIADTKAREGSAIDSELQTVKSELLRLDRVVNTFLDFNRPLELHLSDCDLTEIARSTADLIRPQAAARGVTVIIEPRVDRAVINGDRDLLMQCVLNIAINGLEAMSGHGRLAFLVERTGDEFVLSVEDEGGGIPPEIQDKIFNLYFTTKATGTGIGLAIAYRFVQLHSGNITFESDPGKGTRFFLRFPASKPEELAA
jgi:signal transduction histidine kinase